MPHNPLKLFLTQPLYAPLLFPNEASDARDHAANERTFLAYLRLAVYLAVVSVAVFINFHLKHAPPPIEIRISRPLGYTFWLLSLACLSAGFANYVKTVAKYARRAALVQSGLKTQIVFGVVSTSIIAACGVFIAAEAQKAAMKGNTMLASISSPGMVANYHVSTEHAISAQEQLLRLFGEAAGIGPPL